MIQVVKVGNHHRYWKRNTKNTHYGATCSSEFAPNCDRIDIPISAKYRELISIKTNNVTEVKTQRTIAKVKKIACFAKNGSEHVDDYNTKIPKCAFS